MSGRAELSAPAIVLAPRLLGAVISSRLPEPVAVRITEVEAYAGAEDPASHAFRGPSPRNSLMFGPPGHLYVYFTYGMHWCANVVCAADGTAAAVLLRAGEVVEGLEVARSRRGTGGAPHRLASGPARLAQCLGLDGDLNGADLFDPDGRVGLVGVRRRRPRRTATGPRVGISRAQERPWRFWLDGDPTVSAYRAADARRAGARDDG